MSEFSSGGRPDLLVAGGDELDGLLGPLAAYLDALEARVGALEAQMSALRLMTAADAARYARVNVETILRAVRAGELSVAGYVGHPRGHRLLRRPGVAGERPAMLSRRHGRRWAEIRAAAHHSYPADSGHHRQVPDKARSLSPRSTRSCSLASACLRGVRA
jgi:hypothetical protein